MSRRRNFNLLFGGAAVDPTPALLAKFAGAGDEVALRCNVATGTTRYIISQHLGNRKYWSVNLYAPEALSVGNEWMSIDREYIRSLYGGYNSGTTPAVTLSGPDWQVIDSASYPGGRLMYQSTTPHYAQFTTPAGTTAIGAVSNQSAGNVGLALITIDGDTTLATLLPTAQEVVDSGAYANTILVANGGSLNPTDRVWDQYQQSANYPGPPGPPSSNHYELFATGLTAGAHVVRVTVTGYKRAAASSSNVVLYMILAYGPTIHNIASATYEACLLPEVDVFDITGTFPRPEISYNTQPTGATGTEWVGHSGSLKFLVVPKVYIDGVETAIVNGQVEVASEIIVTQQLRVRHSEIGGGATEVGVLDLTYTMNETTGLTIAHTLNWSMGGVANGYPCMMTVEHSVFDRFQTVGSGAAASDLTDQDDSLHFSTSAATAYAWDADGSAAKLMYIPDLAATVESWAKSTNKLHWHDMSSADLKKAYAERFAGAETFTADTVWTSEANYRAAWFADGAANNLS